jgi:hypothetical protein
MASGLSAIMAKTKCYLCDQVGHWANACPNRGQMAPADIKEKLSRNSGDFACLRCGDKGHSAIECCRVPISCALCRNTHVEGTGKCPLKTQVGLPRGVLVAAFVYLCHKNALDPETFLGRILGDMANKMPKITSRQWEAYTQQCVTMFEGVPVDSAMIAPDEQPALTRTKKSARTEAQ